MNLYTKVLRLFMAEEGFRPTVGFEAPPEADRAQGKLEEARAALRDLGLPDDVKGG